jgi:hypothetical protein
MRTRRRQALVAASAAALCAALCATATAWAGAPKSAAPAPGAAPLTPKAQRLLQWITRSKDHGTLPFMVIDKHDARVWVFDAQGQLTGAAPVLLGLAVGDDSVPGIGDKPLASIKPQERTTPAGRFVVEPGRNLRGEDILWIDYAAAVSMHRLRELGPEERRQERLASPTPADNRVSYGCINVAPSFYERVLQPAFTRQRGIAYVLPEVRSLEAVFKLDAPPP